MEYFITEGSKTVGPFTKEELKAKNISGNSLVYTDETNWVEAKTISDLRDAIRKLPPPPPPKQEPAKTESSYYTVASPMPTNQPSSKNWLYGLLITLGLGGGGTFMYQQEQEKGRLQDEVRSRDMQKQEEEARAVREEMRRKIEEEKRELRSQIASLETDYSVQKANLEKVEGFHFLRSAQEREDQIRIVNGNMRSIEEAMRIRNEKLQELANSSN